MDDLATVLPAPATLTVAGVPVDVSPLRLGELAAMQGLLRQLRLPVGDDGTPDVFALMVGEQAEVALNALSVATRQPRTWIDALQVDEAAQLAVAVIEANVDFLVRRVFPELARGTARIQTLLGPTSSNG